MRLRRIHLEHFRNIGSAALCLEERCYFLIGKNGQGKSNLLEAAGLVTALRSFRTARWVDLIAHGQPRSRLYFEIQADSGRTHRLLLTLDRRAGRSLSIDDQPLGSYGQLIGRFPTVTLCAEDIRIVQGSPADRRRFLDLSLSSLDPDYFPALQAFYRILRERNALLKSQPRPDLLRAFNQPFAEAAVRLTELRRTHLAAMEPILAEHYRAMAGTTEEPSFHYRPQVESADPDLFIDHIARERSREIEQRTSLTGPHRDELTLLLNGEDARHFASEGQQRNLAIALRLAEIDRQEKRQRERPVLLLDDVLNELDGDRQGKFWERLHGDWQVLASGTREPFSPDLPWRMLRVEGGRFTPVSG